LWLYPAGQVRFGFAGRGLWGDLDGRRDGPAMKGVIPIAPLMLAEIKFFGRYKGGAIRDGVLMAIGDIHAAQVTPGWSCDIDETVGAFDLEP
jgi:hypothetical protein